jgi:hypothetical protein
LVAGTIAIFVKDLSAKIRLIVAGKPDRPRATVSARAVCVL